MLELLTIVERFVHYTSPEGKIQLFHKIDYEVQRIILLNKDNMAILLRLTWWKERLEDINHSRQTNLSPMLNEIKNVFDLNEISLLFRIFELYILLIKKQNFDDTQELLKLHLIPLAKATSELLQLNENIIFLYYTIRQLECFSYQHSDNIIEGLINEAQTKSLTMKNHLKHKVEKIYYWSFNIIIKRYNLYTRTCNINPGYFRILLATKLII